MHPASFFHEADSRLLEELVSARGFASIIGIENGRPVTAAAPIMLKGVTARFHLSSRNRLTPALVAQETALAVVMIDDAYISPDWYAAADQVPTWNYRSVELEGSLRVLARAETAVLLDDLSAHFEATLAPKPPWTRAKMRPEAFEAMLGAITGFEMTVERLEGTIKLSQNKPADEIERVAKRLAERPDAGSQAVSRAMSTRIATPPSTSDTAASPPADRASAPSR